MSDDSAEISSRTSPVVWRNGRIVDAESGGVSPFDHGLLTGDGVFETLFAKSGVPFAESRHHARLLKSAAVMGLTVPSQEVLSAAMAAVLSENGLAGGEARIRVTLTGGDSPLGSARGEAQHTALVAASTFPAFAAFTAVVTVPFVRNERGALVGVKSTSYGENVVALKYAKRQGAGEAIFGNTVGNLCEGTGTNIFVVDRGKLITPPLSSGCLAGVTRGVVLEVCAREGIEVVERDLPLAQLETVDEAFLTSTLRHVQAVNSVNGKPLAMPEGGLTDRITSAFRAFSEHCVDP